MEREKREAFKAMQEFLVQAVREGAHKEKPRLMSEDMWVRNRNIVGIYVGSSKATEEEVGKKYDLTRERVRQIGNETAAHIHRHSSPETQQRFPLSELSFGKLISQKKDETPQSHIKHSELALKFREARSRKELRTLVKMVTWVFLRRYSLEEDRLFTSMRRFLSESGFHCSNREIALFVQALRKKRFVVSEKSKKGENRTSREFFLPVQEEASAKRTLLENPEFHKFLANPVERVFGPEKPDKEMPSITQFWKGVEWVRVGSLLASMSIPYGGGRDRFQIRDFLTEECPVPIYRHERSYYYHIRHKRVLERYLRKRLGELNRSRKVLPISG